MRKAFLFSSLAALVFASVGFAANRAIEASADNEDNALAALLRSYIHSDAKAYTKKTAIYLTEEARTEFRGRFHAGANRLYQTTHYDEDVNGGGALLMVGYDDTYSINSGYITLANGVHHFRSDDDAPNMNTMFAADHYTDEGNWHPGKTLGECYETLTTLATFANAGTISENPADNPTWVKNGNVYTHTVPEGGLVADEDGYYTDEVLHKFQYFAAPMLLDQVTDNHFLSPTRVVVMPATDYLSIRIFTAAEEASKLLFSEPTDVGDCLLAEARVFCGLNLFADDHYSVRGSFNEFKTEGEIKCSYLPSVNLVEQYEAIVPLTAGQYFRVYSGPYDSTGEGAGNLEDGSWTYVSGDTGGNTDITARVTGNYHLYWKPGEAKQLAISVSESKFYVSGTFNSWASQNEDYAMERNADTGVYTLSGLNLIIGSEFKVSNGVDWLPENNVYIPENGKYDIAYTPSTGEVVATKVGAYEGEIAASGYYYSGTSNNWAHGAAGYELYQWGSPKGDYNQYYIDVDMSAGEKFKVMLPGDSEVWYGTEDCWTPDWDNARRVRVFFVPNGGVDGWYCGGYYWTTVLE